MMPGELNGLQVLDAIKSDPQLKDTRVIMVTARGQAHDYEDGVQRGADHRDGEETFEIARAIPIHHRDGRAAAEAEPQNDLNASPEYRVHLAKVLVRRALEESSK